jgi:hypothetical protein
MHNKWRNNENKGVVRENIFKTLLREAKGILSTIKMWCKRRKSVKTRIKRSNNAIAIIYFVKDSNKAKLTRMHNPSCTTLHADPQFCKVAWL